MRGLRSTLVGIVAGALAITAVAAPAATANSLDGRIAIVQGIPYRSVDICLNGTEVRSGLKYGARYTTRLVKGFYTLKVFAKSPRRCKGLKLARQLIEMEPSDLTIVVTKKDPKVVVWSNDGLGTMPAANPAAAIVWRHAADLGEATFKFRQTTPEMPLDLAALPTPADPAWQKTNQRGVYPMPPGFTWRTRVTRPGKNTTIAGPITRTMRGNRRYELILIGTKNRNARLVALTRAIQPLP